jgi:glycerol kinase
MKNYGVFRKKFCLGFSRFFGIPLDILPEIKSSATIFGYINKGILQGIPIGAVKA